MEVYDERTGKVRRATSEEEARHARWLRTEGRSLLQQQAELDKRTYGKNGEGR